MFSTIIYIIIALILYHAADVFDLPGVCGLFETGMAIGAALLFWKLCSLAFSRLTSVGGQKDFSAHTIQADRLTTRFSLAALILFAMDIYIFRLPLLLEPIVILSRIPTLGALVSMFVFLVYLCMIWGQAYKVQKHVFPDHITRIQFIYSNLGFALPALLPWVCISLVSDLIHILPFAEAKQLLESPTGSAGILALLFMGVALFAPEAMQKIWKCTILEPGPERDLIEQTCRRQNIAFRNILNWNIFGSSMITAGVMGITPRFRYILVTRALLTHLNPRELEAVILHEIGHVKARHPMWYLILFAGYIACTFLLFQPVMLLLCLASPLYADFSFPGLSKTNAHALIMVTGLIVSMIVFFRFGFGFVMRNCERQADLYIFDAKYNPSHLISSFFRIVMLTGQSLDHPSWHHFSIGQRIRFLEQCWKAPEKITSHHKKVRRILTGFLCVFLVLCVTGYQISFGSWGKPFSAYLAEKILARHMEKHPDDPNMILLLADTYYEHKSFQKAADAYETAIGIDQDNVHALNNLAWLFLTCPDMSMRDPSTALQLSSRAAGLSQEAHVWDTQALALSENGLHAQALQAAQKALQAHMRSGSVHKTSYFENQIKKFQQAIPRQVPN